MLKNIFMVFYSWYQSLRCFNKAIAFLSVLLVSQRLVNYGITRMAITYADNMLGGNILVAAALTNVLDGLSSVFVFVLTHISDAWTGRFWMVFFTCLANLMGCWLFFISDKFQSIPIFVISILLLCNLSESEDVIGTAFVGDQIHNQEDPDRVVSHAKFWSRLCKIVGTIASLLVGTFVTWELGFISTANTIGLISFLVGFCYYNHKPPTGSPLSKVYTVVKAAYLNRRLEYPTTPMQFHQNDNFELQLAPRMKFFRCLDKAAIMQECPTISSEDQERRGMVCPVRLVKDVKNLLSVLPMWMTFLVYCIVSATGDSFYILQADKMQDSYNLFIVLFITQSLAELSSGELSKVCLRIIQIVFPTTQPRTWNVSMNVGMICASLSCFFALCVEKKRLQLYDSGLFDNDDGKVYMNICWLVPQFLFFGLTKGLCSDTLQRFYDSQVSESMKSYGPPFNKCVLGFGKMFSIFSMVAFKHWFGSTVNDSHLDRYYLFVAILALSSLFPFYYVSSLQLYDGAVDHPLVLIKEIELSVSSRVHPVIAVDKHESC